MRLRHLYLVLCAAAVILTYSQIIPFTLEHGPDINLMVREQFASNATAFFGYDLLVVAIAAVVFIIAEARRLRMKRLWIPIAATFVVGISLALPLFLYMRERHLKR